MSFQFHSLLRAKGEITENSKLLTENLSEDYPVAEVPEGRCHRFHHVRETLLCHVPQAAGSPVVYFPTTLSGRLL